MHTVRATMHPRTMAMLCLFADDGCHHTERAASAWVTATPGIVVTEYVRSDGTHAPYPVLTHEESGRLIGGPYRSLAEALSVAGALGGLGDWTKRFERSRTRIVEDARTAGLYEWFVKVRRGDSRTRDLAEID